MPRKFVNRLREIRKLQKERQAQAQQQSLRASAAQSHQQKPFPNAQAFDNTAIDELVDELS